MPYLSSFASSSFSIRRLKFPGTFSVNRKLASTALAHLSNDTQLAVSCEEAVSSSSCDSSSVHNSFEIGTFKVVEILNCFLREPTLALFFFRQLKKQGFQHNISTYAALIRILSYWGLNRNLDSLFVQLIAPLVKLNFEIEDLFEVLDGFGVEANQHLLRAFDALVKTCVSVNMFDEAIHFVFENRRGIIPHIFTCNFLISRLVKHDKVDMAFDTYEKLKRLGLSPNDFTYTILIKGLFKSGKLEEADYVIREMEEAGMPLCSFFFSTCIEGLCNRHAPDLGYRKLQECRKANGPIDMFAYTSVIRGFCNEMKLDEAECVILDMEEQGLVPDVFIYTELIRGYCRSGNLHEALALHDYMISKGIKTNCVIVSCLLHGLCNVGRNLDAVDKFKEFKKSGMFLDVVAYNVVLSAFFELGKVDDARKLLEDMKHKSMVLDIKHYTTLIRGYFLQGKPILADNTFKEMEKKGLKPDIVTYNVLASGWSRNGHVDKTMQVLDDMKTEGVKPNTITHKMIIEGLCSGGKVEEAETFFNKLEYTSDEIYSAMINGYCEANFPNKAYDIFFWASKRGYVVERNSYCKLLCKLCDEGETNEAIYLLKKLLSWNVKSSRIMHCKALAALCQAGNMKTAHSLFVIFVKRGFTPDVKTYSLLKHSYCKTKIAYKKLIISSKIYEA